MNIIQGSTALLIGYLFGCFQTSYFISKMVSQKDIREIGSGNAGASNVTSELGWKYGILTGFSDVLKAYIPTQIVLYIFPGAYQPLNLIALAGTGAVLGHIYPFFLDFRGGKGIACYIGLLLAMDWQIGVATIIGLIFITIITDYVAVGSIALYIIIPLLAYYSNHSDVLIGCAVVLFGVGMIKHWINVQRILGGTETGLRSVFKKHSSENSTEKLSD
jgi:glycerol-3-phosphate acyltransferase PlsY